MGFNRGANIYGKKVTYEGIKYAQGRNGIGATGWLMETSTLEKDASIDIIETIDPPKEWCSGWIDDLSYRKRLVKEGYEHSFVYLRNPSLVDHIGAHGIHCHGGVFPRGTDKNGKGA